MQLSKSQYVRGLQCHKALDIQAGDMASMIYADLDRIDDENVRQKIRDSLLDYCKLDTRAMVMIWRELGNIAETSRLSP